MLYLIRSFGRAHGKSSLKVGYTSDITSRMRTYLHQNPFFELISTREGSEYDETCLHLFLSGRGLKEEFLSEWFIDSPDVLSGFHVSLEKAKREIWRKRDLLFGREILMSTDNLKRRIYEDLRMVNRYSSRPLKKEIDQLWERDIRKREYKRIVSLIEEDKL